VSRTQTDLDGELAAVLASGKQLQAAAHGAGVWIGLVAVPVTFVYGAESVGQQHFDGLTEQLLSGEAKQHLGLSVDDLDAARSIDDHDRIGCRLEQATELRFRSFCLSEHTRLLVSHLRHRVEVF
jgi:hypothetical protein